MHEEDEIIKFSTEPSLLAFKFSYLVAGVSPRIPSVYDRPRLSNDTQRIASSEITHQIRYELVGLRRFTLWRSIDACGCGGVAADCSLRTVRVV